MNVREELKKPWSQPWPAEDLELVVKCPVCSEEERHILCSDLVDNVFRVAPGKWTLYECQSCQSAYLDPRPTPESIGRAYATYYTHNAAQKSGKAAKLGYFRLIRRTLANGYTNSRYGTKYSPSSRMGKLFARLFHTEREKLDSKFRWLAKPSEGQRLLDIGCGNGAFLDAARDAGWQVVGIDPDPAAIEATRQLSLNAYVGSVEDYEKQLGQFDAITLSHVIEHLHNPQQTMATVYNLLKPGGRIYLETPNIQSAGFSLFTKNWRGIEAPRHVVIYSFSGLQYLLKFCGFVCIEYKYRRAVKKDMYLKSRLLSLGYSPYAPYPTSLPIWWSFKIRALKETTSRCEFITITARK